MRNVAIMLVSLFFSGVPVGFVMAIVVELIALFTNKVVWYWTTIVWVAGLAVGAWVFRAYESDWDTLWYFVGAVIGSGVIVWPIHILNGGIDRDFKKKDLEREGSRKMPTTPGSR